MKRVANRLVESLRQKFTSKINDLRRFLPPLRFNAYQVRHYAQALKRSGTRNIFFVKSQS